MDHPVVLESLSDYLTLGELGRLRRALGTDRFDACPHLGHLAMRRIRLIRPAPNFQSLSRVMTSSKHRCRECGCATHRQIRVCNSCANEKNGYFQLVSRREILARWRNVRAGLVRRIYENVRPATRRSTGELLYWRGTMDTLMTSCGHAPMQE